MRRLETMIGESAKHCVIGAVCTVILYVDSIVPIYYVIGGMGNAVLSKVLKKIIKEPRPENSPKIGHGMPSSHAQSIYYFTTVLVSKISSSLYQFPPLSVAQGVMRVGGLFTVLSYSYYACAYRIRSGRHTMAQTVVGALVGTVVGAAAAKLEGSLVKHLLFAVGGATDMVHHDYAPIWLRLTVIGTCIVGLYAKDAIFGILGVGDSAPSAGSTTRTRHSSS